MSINRQKPSPAQGRQNGRPKEAVPGDPTLGARGPLGDAPYVGVQPFAPSRALEHMQPPSRPMFLGAAAGEDDDAMELGGGGYGAPAVGGAGIGVHNAMGIRPAAGDSPVLDDGMPPTSGGSDAGSPRDF